MFTTIIGGIFILMAIYTLASLSGLFAERSGTINLAINGGMIMGAIGYIMTTKLFIDVGIPLNWGIAIFGIVIGIIFAIVITSLLSFAAINLKGNQIIVGTAINILAPIISLIIIIAITNGQQLLPTANLQVITKLSSTSFPAWEIQLMILGFTSLIVGFLFFLIRFTPFGLRLRAAGENPHTLAAAGISVFMIRHIAMIISGALAGLSGALAVTGFIKFASFSSSIFGMGFVALAILILGQWRIQWVSLGALGFAIIYIIAYIYGPKLSKNQWYIYMIPYIGILVTLPLISIKSQIPKAEGIPYENKGR